MPDNTDSIATSGDVVVYNRELDLYAPILEWLELSFLPQARHHLGRSYNQAFVADVHNVTMGSGLWCRPDLSVLALGRSEFIPDWNYSLYSFEVKTAKGVDEKAVYEALSHTKFVHYSTLIWQTYEGDQLSSDIIALCSQFGLGAITFRDAGDLDSYEWKATPNRHSIDGALIDQFVRERYPEETKGNIATWMNGQGWPRQPHIGGQE